MTKTQNPSIHDPRFEEFMISSLDDFVDSERDKLLLCPSKLSGNISWDFQEEETGVPKHHFVLD